MPHVHSQSTIQCVRHQRGHGKATQHNYKKRGTLLAR